MKKTDPETLVAELVRANTAALAVITAQLGELVAATAALMRAARQPPPPPPSHPDATTRKVELSPELLAELGGEPAPLRRGRPPGVRQR